MPASSSSTTVLGLFPSFGEGHLGGIQASAEIAWDAVSKNSIGHLITYSKDGKSRNGHNHANDSRVNAVLRALRSPHSPDVVLVWQMGLLKLVPFLRHAGKRVILYLHGIEAWRSQDWLTDRITPRVDLFLTNSDYTWQRFIQFNPRLAKASQKTVALGIGDLAETFVQPCSPPFAVMLARLSRTENYKGHREVINAWPQVMQRHPSAKLVIAGDGDLVPDLRSAIQEAGMNEHIELVGEISESKKQELLTRARCLLMPSRNEGFGLVYLEAMRLGRPCLVSNLDAGREVVNPPEAGIVADPNNSDELVEGISRLMDQGPDWQSLSQQARKRYENNYTARHFQDRLVAALFSK